MKKLSRRELRKILTEEAEIVEPQGFVSDKIEKYIAKTFRENAVVISEMFPYGTQTIVKKAIEKGSEKLAKCIITIANPVGE